MNLHAIEQTQLRGQHRLGRLVIHTGTVWTTHGSWDGTSELTLDWCHIDGTESRKATWDGNVLKWEACAWRRRETGFAAVKIEGDQPRRRLRDGGVGQGPAGLRMFARRAGESRACHDVVGTDMARPSSRLWGLPPPKSRTPVDFTSAAVPGCTASPTFYELRSLIAGRGARCGIRRRYLVSLLCLKSRRARGGRGRGGPAEAKMTARPVADRPPPLHSPGGGALGWRALRACFWSVL